MNIDELIINKNSDFKWQHCLAFAKFFYLVAVNGFDCEKFCQVFMHSAYATNLASYSVEEQLSPGDVLYDEYMQQYSPSKAQESYNGDVMHWIGFIYMHWHHLTGESFKIIYAQANLERMSTSYLGLHCLQEDLVVEDLKEAFANTKSAGGFLFPFNVEQPNFKAEISIYE